MSEAQHMRQDPKLAEVWIGDRVRGGNYTRPEQIDILMELLSVLQPDGHRLLDLGCGDGLIAELVLMRFPNAYVVGVDSSSPKLEEARARLSPFVGRFTLLAHDLRSTEEPLVEVGAFDAAIAVQSFHHLNALDKQRAFRWASISLRDGGLFLLADRIKLATPALFPYHLKLWNRMQSAAGTEPASPGYSFDDHRARCMLRGDLPDNLSDQLAWLQAAGFGEVDVFYRFVERAVFGGLKVPSPAEAPRLTPHPDQALLRGV